MGAVKGGMTVIFAVIVLAVLIFLMTGTGGLFTPKIVIRSYFDNAGGIRVGAPVALQGVTVGNVSAVKVVPDHGLTPVEIDMKVNKRFSVDIPKDAVSSIASVGVLGEAYIDIDRTRASGPPVSEWRCSQDPRHSRHYGCGPLQPIQSAEHGHSGAAHRSDRQLH